MNIYQKINECRKAINYIQKDGKVANYKAVTHDNVTAQTRNAFIDNGVVIEVKLKQQDVNEFHTKSGTLSVRYEAVFQVDFINIEDGQDRMTYIVPAHAIDTQDKATGKAISYATKYAILKILNIETGENDESRIPEPVRTISEEQIRTIKEKITEVGADEKLFLSKGLRIERLENLPEKFFDNAIELLNKKAKANAKN